MKLLKKHTIFILLILTTLCTKDPVLEDDRLPDALTKEITIPSKKQEEVIRQLQELNQLKLKTYKVGSGDRFNIYIYDEQELSTKDTVVKSDGTLSVKLAGEVYVKNKTLEEASDEIESRLKTYIKYPRVSLIPEKIQSATFTIIGKVNKPGTYQIEKNNRVLDAVAKAAGFTTGIFENNTVEMADLEHSFLSRKGDLLPVNFIKLVKKGDMLHNIPLLDGDYIFIPSAANREVYVIGEVFSPGYFGYRENFTLMQIISKARGLRDSASSQAIIVRGSLMNPHVYSFNIDKIMEGLMRDIKLEPNDIVFIPKSVLGKWNKILGLIMPSLEATRTGLILRSNIR